METSGVTIPNGTTRGSLRIGGFLGGLMGLAAETRDKRAGVGDSRSFKALRIQSFRKKLQLE